MATRRRYRLKKRVKNFLIFYMFVCILFVASYTLSRYVQVSQGISGIEIAKFNVSVNDVNVKDGQPIQFNFSEASTFVSKKVAPDSSGYFEFILNPAETEVSLEYEFNFNTDEVDEDFKLTYFTLNDGEHQNITEKNIIKNDLLLKTTTHGFTDDDKLNIKVYWSWDEKEDFVNPNILDYENKNINVVVMVKQKLKQ